MKVIDKIYIDASINKTYIDNRITNRPRSSIWSRMKYNSYSHYGLKTLKSQSFFDNIKIWKKVLKYKKLCAMVK